MYKFHDGTTISLGDMGTLVEIFTIFFWEINFELKINF